MSSNFDPTKIHEDIYQVFNWVHGKNNSIFVSNIPSNLTEESVKAAFEFLGDISKIEFKQNKKNVIIYFSQWTDSQESLETRTKIAKKYPEAHKIVIDSLIVEP